MKYTFTPIEDGDGGTLSFHTETEKERLLTLKRFRPFDRDTVEGKPQSTDATK